MPMYEYMCKKRHHFTMFMNLLKGQTMIVKCPKCGENAIKLMSAANILVKDGTGRFHK